MSHGILGQLDKKQSASERTDLVEISTGSPWVGLSVEDLLSLGDVCASEREEILREIQLRFSVHYIDHQSTAEH